MTINFATIVFDKLWCMFVIKCLLHTLLLVIVSLRKKLKRSWNTYWRFTKTGYLHVYR